MCWVLTTRQPLWVILCHLPEKGRKEIEDSREDERDGQRRKREMKESDGTEEITTVHLYPFLLQGQQAMPNCKSIYQLGALVTKATRHLRLTQAPQVIR